MNQSLLSVEQLVVSYGIGRGRKAREFNAINGVNLEVHPGRMTAVVGESGSGKSTTAKAAIGLLADNAVIDAGRITFDGRDVTDYVDREWQRLRGTRIGLIPQDPTNSLNPVKTIGASVAEGLRIHSKLPAAETEKRVIELLERVGINDPVRRARQYPHELSGGMNQRVLIAAALALEPDLIVADEPTSALDVTVQKIILDLLDEMRAELNIGVLFITHDLAVAGDRADDLVVMQGGEVREIGPAAAVLSDPQDNYTRRLLADAPSLTVADVATERPSLREQTLVEVENVSRQFGDFTAVDGVSFSVATGSTHAIVGESGSGKSTLGRMISAFTDPSSGTVTIGGADVASLDDDAKRRLRSKVQLVYQNPYASLDPRQRIGDIIAEPLRNAGGYSKSAINAKVKEYLERVALDPALGTRRPAELSGGQRQRVAIARALIIEPELIILDEAVSALDVTVQVQILQLLDDLQRDLGLTYIFISHDLAVVRQISDTVGVMHAGRQVELGSTASVFSNPQSEYTRQLLDAIPGERFRTGVYNLGL